MTAGYVAMQLLTPAVFTKLDELGKRLQKGLEKAFAEKGVEGQVTGDGSLRRLHFGAMRLHDYRSAYSDAAKARRMSVLHRAMLRHGVLMASTGLMALSTAMSIADIDEIVNAFRKSLTDTLGAA
jgi:glutamate-1-semialdehyde 2,1-aminomutase